MKTIEVRRASMRVKPEKKLSRQGVRLARALGPYLGGPYHAYYASPAKRSRDTLKALGFPTFKELDALGPLPGFFDRFERELLIVQRRTGCSFFEGYLEIPDARARLELVGKELADEFLSIQEKLPESGRALAISHSGVIEALGMALRPEAEPCYVREPLRHLEGLGFDFVDGMLTQLRLLTIPNEIVALLATAPEPDPR